MNQIPAAAIGERASLILAAGGAAHVIGSTSRGVFLVNSAGEVVFISYESWRGPLTINLTASQSQPYFSKTTLPFNQVDQWDVVQFKPGQVIFTGAKINVQTSHLKGWNASAPILRERTGLRERAKAVGAVLLDPIPFKGWAGLLSHWMDPATSLDLPELLKDIQSILSSIHTSLESGDQAGLLADVAQILGKGEGLTPSGDDLVMGLLFVASRYPEFCSPIIAQPAVKAGILQLSRQKTTWLGACLIESAAEGQADERLVKALDGMMSGDLDPTDTGKLLRAYGSSSGSDAFLGIFLAIQ